MSGQEPEFGSAGDLTSFDLRLIDEYLKANVPVDRLAYTEAFERIFAALASSGDTRSRAELYFRLLNLRKSGRLPRLTWSESA